MFNLFFVATVDFLAIGKLSRVHLFIVIFFQLLKKKSEKCIKNTFISICLDSPLISCSSAKGGDDSYFLFLSLRHFWLEVVNEVDFCLLDRTHSSHANGRQRITHSSSFRTRFRPFTPRLTKLYAPGDPPNLQYFFQ